jgi:hypothetical protein
MELLAWTLSGHSGIRTCESSNQSVSNCCSVGTTRLNSSRISRTTIVQKLSQVTGKASINFQKTYNGRLWSTFCEAKSRYIILIQRTGQVEAERV